MSVYDLAGIGIQALTSGTARLYVAVITLNPVASNGRANPPNLYDQGLLRPGVGDFYYPVIPIDSEQMVFDLPSGITNLGYALFGTCEINVSEDSPPPPTGTSVTTNQDGNNVSAGDSITITWARTGTPDVNDYVGIVDSNWSISLGRSFGYLTAPHFPYTSSETDTAGGTPQASGSVTGTLQATFAAPQTLTAIYVDGASGTLLGTGPTFNLV